MNDERERSLPAAQEGGTPFDDALAGVAVAVEEAGLGHTSIGNGVIQEFGGGGGYSLG